MVLAAVAATVLGGGFALRRRRRRPDDPPVPQVRAAAGFPAAARNSSDPARSLVRMAFGAGIVVVLAILTVVVSRPADHARRVVAGPSPYPHPSGPFGFSADLGAPLSLAECQAAIASALNPDGRLTCGYETTGLDRIYDEPSADPNDPRWAGAALPTALSTDGRVCVAGSERPVLDTVRPTLSASFTPVPGLRSVASTFQITGVYGRTADDVQLPGNFGDPLTATLDFSRERALKHDQSYRWRVRGTPLGVGAGGWSPWCEFTIPKTTPDDLGLDQSRTYRVALTAAQWQEVLRFPTTTTAIAAAVKAATPAATVVPVTLNGGDWTGLVTELAGSASQNDNQATWELADRISSALGGPDRPTMGFPRGH